MAIKTGRADGTAQITLATEKCNDCGICAEVCKGAPLIMIDGRLEIEEPRFFGCIGCGHCMCVCPQECIQINGRDMQPADVIPLPGTDKRADYQQLYDLILSRRSVRNFRDRLVEPEIIDKITAAVATAPMGLPPSDVEILVFDTPAKVQEFAADLIAVMKKSRWLFSPLFSVLMRPFLGREYIESVNSFIRPALDIFIEEIAKGHDYLLYNAPLAMYFHCSPYADPADPLVAATYAMLAAESLGLGSCMIGTPAYFIKYSKDLKQKYNLPRKNQPGIVVIFGYPRIRFRKALRRRLAKVTYR
ncbi:MAG TPA: nitroreductase family protein [Syntrophomonadaceae bacterium]|nr:nitroreductase family protein [Syntrophomonadaceae bacterium]